MIRRKGGWSPIPGTGHSIAVICASECASASSLPQGSSCPLPLAGLRTLHLHSETVTFACSSLLCVADPHTDGVQRNWSEFGVSVAEISQPWVGEDSARHSQNVLEPCGEWRSHVKGGMISTLSLPRSSPCWMARTGWDRVSPEMQGLCPHLLLSSRVLCLVLQGMSKSV